MWGTGSHFGKMGLVRGRASGALPATLTLPLELPLGDTSGYIGVTSDTGGGTLYWVVTTSATPPSAAQIAAGQDHTGSAAASSGSGAASAGVNAFTATGLSSNTPYWAYRVQNNGTDSGVSAGAGFTTLTTGTSDTSLDDLVAAASVAPSDLRKGYVARFIGALYAASVWSKIDVLWVPAAHDEQFGRLNWKSPGSFTLTAINSPAFTTDRGFTTTNAGAWLDTGWDYGTNGSNYTQDNAGLSVYQRTGAGQNAHYVSNHTTGSYRVAVGGQGGTGRGARVNSATNTAAPAGGAFPQLITGRRNSSATQSILIDGVEVTAPSAATSTSGAATADIGIGRFGTNNNGGQACALVFHSYFDDTEMLAIYNALHDYMVALGADT